MDANPDTELHFNWKFNTTANTVNIPVCLDCLAHCFYFLLQASDITHKGFTSMAKDTPRTELDFLTLICCGANSVGRGVPCVHHLLPIGLQFHQQSAGRKM